LKMTVFRFELLNADKLIRVVQNKPTLHQIFYVEQLDALCSELPIADAWTFLKKHHVGKTRPNPFWR
jgi:hypothetical protein